MSYTKQVFLYSAAADGTADFRSCDTTAGTTDFQHSFMVIDCPYRLTFADGKDVTEQCTCPTPVACGAYGRSSPMPVTAGHNYYVILIATTYASWPYTRASGARLGGPRLLCWGCGA